MKSSDDYLYFNDATASGVFSGTKLVKTNTAVDTISWAVTNYSGSQIIHKSYGYEGAKTLVLYNASTTTIYLVNDSNGAAIDSITGIPYFADARTLYFKVSAPTGDARFHYKRVDLILHTVSEDTYPKVLDTYEGDLDIPTFRQKNQHSIYYQNGDWSFLLKFGAGLTGQNCIVTTPLYITSLGIEKIQDGTNGEERLKFTMQINLPVAGMKVRIVLYGLQNVDLETDSTGEAIAYSNYIVASQSFVRYEVPLDVSLSNTTVPTGYS